MSSFVLTKETLQELGLDDEASARRHQLSRLEPGPYLGVAAARHHFDLAPLGFVQIERSLLVNLRRVAYVERHERGQFCFVMRGGARC